jgi:hypothetical protein
MMAYAKLEDALRNTLPVDPALIPEDPVLPHGYSAWQDKHGTVHFTSWKGMVYEVQEYNCSPDGTVTHGNRVTKNSRLRIVLVSAEGFSTPEDMVLDQKPMHSIGAASVFGSFAGSLKSAAIGAATNAVNSAVNGAIKGIGDALGGALSSALGGASSNVKGVINKVKGFFNPSAAGPGKIVGEIANKLGVGGLLGGKKSAGGGSGGSSTSKKLQKTVNPASAGEYTSAASAKSVMGMMEHPFSVKIVSAVNPSTKILFTVSPTVDESCSASYDAVQPIHFPSAIQVYKATNARTLNVNGKFISRTPQEASRTLEFLNYIRSWVMPYFGSGTDPAKLGAPPDILILSAYGKFNLKDVPVVMMTYSWTYPEDIDYIPSEQGYPVPRIIDVSLSFVETHAPIEFQNFNLMKFKDGDLQGAYNYKTNKADMQTRRSMSANPDNKWFGEDLLGAKAAKAGAAGAGAAAGVAGAAAGAAAGVLAGLPKLPIPTLPDLAGIAGGAVSSVTQKVGELSNIVPGAMTGSPEGSDPKPVAGADSNVTSSADADIAEARKQIATEQAKVELATSRELSSLATNDANTAKAKAAIEGKYAGMPDKIAEVEAKLETANKHNSEIARLNVISRNEANEKIAELNAKIAAAEKAKGG